MSQLLPDKFVPLRQSLLGQGAVVLAVLKDEKFSVARLYVESKRQLPHLTYDNFVLTMDWLYIAGSIVVDDHVVQKGISGAKETNS
ncbi:ABC-three component system middle component 6 [Paeniglutamicibacter sp. MACA_103]|uniref:ABC-three component system middle component 6 n=1 Tax=Paeniglutamicibacter sp. MACA_103 TaxID=3377337 RepID=UPI003894C441